MKTNKPLHNPDEIVSALISSSEMSSRDMTLWLEKRGVTHIVEIYAKCLSVKAKRSVLEEARETWDVEIKHRHKLHGGDA
jgi:hypothetical protein